MYLQATDVIDRLLYGEWGGKSGDKFTQISNLLLIVASVSLFVKGFRRINPIRRGATIALCLAGLLICSSAWSMVPALSLRQNLLYLSGVLSAIGIVSSFEGDDIMDLVARISFLAAILSLVLLVVSPATVTTVEGDFRGIFSQKNSLGAAMTMGALATLHSLSAGKRSRISSIVFLIFILFAAIKSASSTSTLTIFIFITTGFIIWLIQKGSGARIVGIFGAIVIFLLAVFAASSWGSILELLGKDPTLTGRTDLWALVMPNIFQKPFLGWGYMAFWSTGNPAAMQISDALGWVVPQAHNGILEMLLNVGLVGTVFFLLVWLRNLRLSLRCMRTSDKSMGSSCFLSWIGLLFVGATEVVLVYPGASTVMFFLTGLFCERADYIHRHSSVFELKRDVRYPPSTLARGRAKGMIPARTSYIDGHKR